MSLFVVNCCCRWLLVGCLLLFVVVRAVVGRGHVLCVVVCSLLFVVVCCLLLSLVVIVGCCCLCLFMVGIICCCLMWSVAC